MQGGCVSNGPAACDSSSAMEEDYCVNASKRFHHQWATTGTFTPAALRIFGVTGEPVLIRSLKQAQVFSANFSTCFLGIFHPSSDTAAAREEEQMLPFHPLLLGPRPPPENLADLERVKEIWKAEVHHAWGMMQVPSEWSRSVCGMVTVPDWCTASRRRRIARQLETASFLGLQVVQVPLPTVDSATEPWSCSSGDDEVHIHDDGTAAGGEDAVALHQQRNLRLICKAADVLLHLIQEGANTKVCVRCDACNAAHRYQLQQLRQAILYGYTKRREGGRTKYELCTPRPIGAAERQGEGLSMRTEVLSRLSVVLYFSSFGTGMTLPSQWLGESIAAVECPPAALLQACLVPDGMQPPSVALPCPLPVNRGDAPLEGGSSSDPNMGGGHSGGSHGNSSSSEPADFNSFFGENVMRSTTDYSMCLMPEDCSRITQPSWTDCKRETGSATSTASEELLPSQQQPQPKRYVYRLPDDVLTKEASHWGGHHPLQLSLISFLVELLRRRVVPIFSQLFFDQYALLNYLYFKCVEDPTRDLFHTFEGGLQLPLQPLGHQLSSGVYEVFERDSRKYTQYREAIFEYTKDWCAAGPQHQHAQQNKDFIAQYGVQPPRVSSTPPSSGAGPTTKTAVESVMYLVLLGCGRGPLIDECLSAVSAMDVRLRIFAIEKNRSAAAFTQMRWENDPEWGLLASAFGHTLEVIVADGRYLFSSTNSPNTTEEQQRQPAAPLPTDFGICDLVVSELLGSFGDNELSPECLEGFVQQLQQVQAARGIQPNPHLVSIPECYTATVAPLMSSPLEDAIGEAAVKGISVCSKTCVDRHVALYHSMLVCNVSRGIALAPPQDCWTFRHFQRLESSTAVAGDDSMEREANLTFYVPPHGRCSAIIGYFRCVLYSPKNGAAPVIISIDPAHRTEDMYSWFPCILPIEPADVRELRELSAVSENSKSATVAIHVALQRRVSEADRRVWYEWHIHYGDGDRRRCRGAETTGSASDGCAPMKWMNHDGWASSVLL